MGLIPGLGRFPGEGKGSPVPGEGKAPPVPWPGEFHGLYSSWDKLTWLRNLKIKELIIK